MNTIIDFNVQTENEYIMIKSEFEGQIYIKDSLLTNL